MAQIQIHALDPHLFTRFNHPRAQEIKLNASYRNIERLTQLLRLATVAVVKEEKFDASLLSSGQLLQSIDLFFIDDTNKYLDHRLAVHKFKQQSLLFVGAYYAIPKTDYGIPNYNQRVLQGLVSESIAIAQALRKFSYEK